MKKLLLALALVVWSGVAFAQCNGVFPANTLCGNLSGSPAPPTAFTASGTVVGPGSSTNGGLVTWANTLGTQIKDGNGTSIPGTYNFTGTVNLSGSPAVAGPGSTTVGDIACWNSTTGQLLKDCKIVPNVQSGNYSIATSDCPVNGGSGVVVETGAFSTITLPSAAGFPSGCTIRIANANSSRAQSLVGAPSGLTASCGGICLEPLTSTTVTVSSGAWVFVQAPGRAIGVSIVYADSALGNDNNDCLASGAAACATVTQAAKILCSLIDANALNNGAAAIQASGTFHSFLFGGCGTPRLIQPNGNPTATFDDGNVPGAAIECDDSCQFQLGASGTVTLNASAAASTLLLVQRSGLVDVTNTTFVSGAGNTAPLVRGNDGANVSLNTGNTYAGGGGTSIGYFVLATRGSRITTGATQTVTGTWSLAQGGCVAASTGVVDVSQGAFSGGTVTGTRWSSATAGGVQGTPNTNCPGNANGTATSPGWTN